MAPISRVRVSLTGFPGAPGVCTFYGLDGPAMQTPLRVMFNSLISLLPQNVHADVALGGDVIDSSTGQLTGTWLGVAQPTINGGAAGGYAAPAGGMLRWATSAIRDGHRVRGRTFIVPLSAAAFDNDGSLTSIAFTTLNDAAVTMVTNASPSFVIWHRPFKGSPATATRPARPAYLGGSEIVTAGSAADKAVVLRSRRD